MKNFFTILLLSLSYWGLAQSFSVDNKSMQVPRFANQTAINTAIPTPAEGMLVFNNALDQFAYYTGTAWVNFPSAGGGGTTYTTHVPINTYANATAINAIASPVEGMIVFNTATNEIFYRSATAWAALPFTSSPWVISGNNISFIGIASNGTSFNTLGNGYVINGGTIADTDATPALHVNSQAGSTNVIRYDGGTNTNAFEQIFTHSTTPANASVEWNHRVISPASTTPMMKLQGDGDLMISGFVGFGEAVSSTVNSTLNTTVTVSNPAVKMRLLTGTINATTMIVPFGGIDPTKIVSVRSMIFRNNTTPNQYVAPGAEISGTAITGNYSLTFTSNPASSGAAGFKLTVANTWINNTYKIFVMFTE